VTERRSVRIVGIVQGVGYRQAARRQAERLGLAGFVRNEPDGSVYAEVEGDPAAVDAFIAWCQEGPPHARVIRVEVDDPLVVTGQAGFSIR
jgi:acylphosphatase